MLRIGKHMVELPIEPFLQPTREGEAMLQSLVRDGVAAAMNVADLFSGCGTFSLAFDGYPDIAAFDDNAGMVAALNGAVKAHGSRIRAERRDLFRRPLSAEELSRYDAVVIDPPRPGAKAQSEQLARSKVPKIVYVSCSPASFSRDARILCDGGYRLIRIVPVDQFLWSSHLELVAFLERPPS
jgi:23S rRNA (uracil1939-C5)-methyltransferase